MKILTRNVLYLFLAGAILTQVGCKKDNQGSATFYVTDNGTTITVSVSGGAANNQQSTISQVYPGGPANCGAAGCANYTLPEGTYNYNASSSLFTWNGSFYITAGQCNLLQLQQSTAPVTFWTATGNYGQITVNLSGYPSQTITSSFSGAPDCNTSGCANFLLPVSTTGTPYTATGSISGNWSGTVYPAIQDQCYTLQLQ